MRGLVATILCLSLLLSLLAAAAQEQPTATPVGPYRVIVHPQNPVTVLDREFVEDAFLKRTTRWPNGTVIYPADLASNSAIRSSFSKELLGRSVAAVKAYWQQRIFSGRGVPPPEFENDEKVVNYVLSSPAAVGYVSRSVDLRGLKPVLINP